MRKELIAGVFILLLTIGTTWYIVEGDTAYYCEDTNVVGLCWKLSNVNAGGLQTRCYYNESTPTKYKNCKTGWNEYIVEIVGNETEIKETGIDVFYSEDKKNVLESVGIGKFEIRNQTCIEFNKSIWDCVRIDDTFLGYSQPIISPCIKKDDYKCKSNIYQKSGINKDIEIITKYCEEYEIEFYNGSCISYVGVVEEQCNDEIVYEEICNEVQRQNCSWQPFGIYWTYECIDYNETICGDQPEQGCNPYLEEQCSYEEIILNLSRQFESSILIYEEVCNVEVQCNYIPWENFFEYTCRNVTICNDEIKQNCSTWIEQDCRYVQVENEIYYDYICNDYNVTSCEDVYETYNETEYYPEVANYKEKVCNDVEIANCTDTYEEICNDVIIGQDCIDYELLNRTTNECKTWKILTKSEREQSILNTTKELFEKIYRVVLSRQIEQPESITDKLILNIE